MILGQSTFKKVLYKFQALLVLMTMVIRMMVTHFSNLNLTQMVPFSPAFGSHSSFLHK